MFDSKVTLRVAVDLNGKRHDFTLATMCLRDIRFKTPRVIANQWKHELAEQISEQISETLLCSAFINDEQFNKDIKRLFQYDSQHN